MCHVKQQTYFSFSSQLSKRIAALNVICVISIWHVNSRYYCNHFVDNLLTMSARPATSPSSFCRLLPKVELHAHLNTSMNSQILEQLHELHQTRFPKDAPIHLPDWLRTGMNFSQVFESFPLIQALTAHPEAVSAATRAVLRDFAAENVKYVELRSTPREVAGRMTKEEYVKAIVTEMAAMNADEATGIEARYLLSIDRRQGLDSAKVNLDLCLKYRELYPNVVMGIDLSGDARHGDLKDYVDLFLTAKKHGLKIAMHLAEVPNHVETELMLRTVAPERVGHATAIHPSTGGTAELWELFKALKIPAEVCLTSNVFCASVDGYDNHHLKFLYAEQCPLVICTDGKGCYFFSSLSDEYLRAAEILQISDKELYQLSLKSVDYIFDGEETKNKLKSCFQKFFETHFVS